MNFVVWFNQLARWASRRAGYPQTFIAAVVIVLIWGVTGPIFDFNTTWQLVINTATTIMTFLRVFLIQNTQNRDTEALQLKLDELIRATKGAHNALLGVEEATEEDLVRIKEAYDDLARRVQKDLKRGRPDTGTPDVIPSNTHAK